MHLCVREDCLIVTWLREERAPSSECGWHLLMGWQTVWKGTVVEGSMSTPANFPSGRLHQPVCFHYHVTNRMTSDSSFFGTTTGNYYKWPSWSIQPFMLGWGCWGTQFPGWSKRFYTTWLLAVELCGPHYISQSNKSFVVYVCVFCWFSFRELWYNVALKLEGRQ